MVLAALVAHPRARTSGGPHAAGVAESHGRMRLGSSGLSRLCWCLGDIPGEWLLTMSFTGTYAETGLRGRRRECAALDALLDRARAGSSGVLVMRGEAGIGKTALLDHVARQAQGFRVAQFCGVESEMELPFGAVHQLLAPMLPRLDQLPGPQREALAGALGAREGGAPDRLLVGLAILGLLADAADEQPLACLIDDSQWLDKSSLQALAFAARRLLAEGVAVVFTL